MKRFCGDYNAEIDRYKRQPSGIKLDEFLDYSSIKWSRNLKRSLRNHKELSFDQVSMRRALYRPFTGQFLYFADIAVDELGQFPRFFPSCAESENQAIARLRLAPRSLLWPFWLILHFPKKT